MILLIVGIVIFLGIHALPWHQGLRQQLHNKLGEKAYKGIYSLIALIGLVLIIIGKGYAPFQSLWMPPTWGRTAAVPLMLVALILLPAANMPMSNIKRIVRHPMLIGIILWACAHLLANGDLASLILFASFGVYSLLAILSANSRKPKSPIAAVPITKDIMVIVAGTIAFALFLFAHRFLFGVPVIV